MYIPTLHWYGEMTFLDDHITQRKRKSSVNGEHTDETILLEDSNTQSYDSDQSLTIQSVRERQYNVEVNTEQVDEANREIVNTRKIDAFSAFADSMAMTLRTMPENIAYKTMAEVQELLYHRKFGITANGDTKSQSENYIIPNIQSDTNETEVLFDIVKEEID
ncbi:uncharacterized protein LOC131801642 [Musca domestica]|uniref:Uncharacterized protein LOC131801642 n=1 Tax=Musca domestica TaxID=7370 RepID=A0ABM3USH9_MUSDO|nr:uncharacterized protein LOC131801642 [Musca domestica]